MKCRRLHKEARDRKRAIVRRGRTADLSGAIHRLGELDMLERIELVMVLAHFNSRPGQLHVVLLQLALHFLHVSKPRWNALA